MNRSKTLLFFVFIALLSSCVTRKQLLILGDNQEEQIIKAANQSYTLTTGDILDINVVGLDKGSVDMFNKRFGGSSSFASDAAFFLNGYIIDDSCNIYLPMLGAVNVRGKTVNEISSELKLLLSKYLKFVDVYVKLVNFRVTVLGEVKQPQTLSLFNNETTIFQVLGMTGGINDFGDKNNVIIIRKMQEGYKRVAVNLNDSKILESDYLYLKPNDLVYIRPLRVKAFQQNRSSLALIVSTLTFITLLINLNSKL